LEGTPRLFTNKPQGLYLKAYFPKEIGEKIPVEELKGLFSPPRYKPHRKE